MANAENIAHGIGITQKTLTECRQAGIDFFTGGNHILKKPAAAELLDDPDIPLIRPANFEMPTPGLGWKTIPAGKKPLLVLNLNGRVFMEQGFADPFTVFDDIYAQLQPNELAGIIVDFHAEATSEKIAFGWHVDSRVSAVLGTHTHIPTADERILTNGTAYITDVGMVGIRDSVLGVDKDIILHNFLNPSERKPHDIPRSGLCLINAVLLTINTDSRQAESIQRITKQITI